jgi:hypothetical protein
VLDGICKRLLLAGCAVGLCLVPNPSHAFSLIGPSNTEISAQNHGSKTPESGFHQAYEAGYRWGVQEITYSIDPAVSDHFGQAGVDAIKSAFGTWDVGFGATVNNHPGIIVSNQPTAHDLESVILHEIGHALGLHHNDQAVIENRNFDKNGTSVGADLDAVMRFGLDKGKINRALTQDDVDGLTYLYDIATMFKVLEQNQQGGLVVNERGGPGDPGFKEAGTAAIGGTVGANIDIFMMDLGNTTQGAITHIYGGAGTAGSFNLTVGEDTILVGGFFNGTPIAMHPNFENPNHGQDLISIDIFINSNPGANLAVIPEPATGTLVILGLGLLASKRRLDFREKS